MLSRLPKVASGPWNQELTCGVTYSSNGSLRENLEASHGCYAWCSIGSN